MNMKNEVDFYWRVAAGQLGDRSMVSAWFASTGWENR
jgi:hypothetical protein